MSLIKCSECNKEVSDKATACPSCGNPINIQSIADNKKVVKIELTNKRWKKLFIAAIVIFFFGIMIAMTSDFGALGILMIFISVILIVWARVGAWWTNG